MRWGDPRRTLGALVLAASSCTCAAPVSPEARPPEAQPLGLQPPPPDMIRVDVANVLSAGPAGAFAIVLQTRTTPARTLHIFIGEAEAFAITLRLNRRQAPRPLTHDLLETLLERLGGKIERIYVEDLRESIFLGRLFLRHDDRIVEIDARPSDSIALALGAGAPIYVSNAVLERAGSTATEAEAAPEPPPEPTRRPAAVGETTPL